MKTCPKCDYERTPTDTSPDYECPSCGVVYEKYAQFLIKRAESEARELLKNSEDQARRESAELERKLGRAQKPVKARRRRKGVGFGGALVALVFASWVVVLVTETNPSASSPPPAAKAHTVDPIIVPADAPENALEKRERTARLNCAEAISAQAAFPSTVSVAWFTGVETVKAGVSNMLVVMNFTANNAMGNTLAFQARCLVRDDGHMLNVAISGR